MSELGFFLFLWSCNIWADHVSFKKITWLTYSVCKNLFAFGNMITQSNNTVLSSYNMFKQSIQYKSKVSNLLLNVFVI